jgi:hypothetical protein
MTRSFGCSPSARAVTRSATLAMPECRLCVRLNLSTRSASVSFGRRGSWLTFGRGRLSASVGLPSTGLRYTTKGGWVPWVIAAIVRLLWALVR